MRRRKNIFNDKRLYVMALLAVVSVGVIVAMAVVSNNKNSKKNKNNIIDLNQVTGEDEYIELTTKKNENNIEEDATTEAQENSSEEESMELAQGEDETSSEEKVTTVEEMETDDSAEVGIIPVGELFSHTEELEWPVVGNIILDYSMDKTVYFPTLDVYRCNAGVLIQSEAGTEVKSSAVGTVDEVSSNEEIGNYIIVDLGDGYRATYGQLKDITVKEGDAVEKGEIIGTVAEPTKYYSIEGCNLYFQLDKDGTPIDPVEYFAY